MRHLTTLLILVASSASTFGQPPTTNLKISHLAGNFYVFTTYNLYKGNRISANGMYLITNSGAVIFDTPWDSTQFQPLLDSIQYKHHKKVIICISTHFHEDRTGGLEYYRNQGIRTYTTKQTDELSSKRGMKRAQYLINKDTVFTVGQYSFSTYYPGPGHAPDNIVIWFDKEKILYGGCLIKSTADTDLGNLSDANTGKYATTIMNVQRKCPNPKYIIPGHDDWTNTKSLEHTLLMAEKIKNQ
jgi:metallo-beta-lactamase class B